jgi:hypothetical protein
MTAHLSKLAVGCDNLASLRQRQQAWHFTRADGQTVYRHRTRYMPKRGEELLAGGSLYWIIANQLVGRQRIMGFEPITLSETSYVLIHLETEPVPVLPTLRRAHQGWRYLEADDTPADDSAGTATALAAMPPKLLAELRSLALL